MGWTDGYVLIPVSIYFGEIRLCVTEVVGFNSIFIDLSVRLDVDIDDFADRKDFKRINGFLVASWQY